MLREGEKYKINHYIIKKKKDPTEIIKQTSNTMCEKYLKDDDTNTKFRFNWKFCSIKKGSL